MRKQSFETALGASFPALIKNKTGYDAAYSPLLQMQFNKYVTKNWAYTIGVQCAGVGIKNVSPFYKYEQYNLGIQLGGRYDFNSSFSVHLGLMPFSGVFERDVVRDTSRSSGVKNYVESIPLSPNAAIQIGGQMKLGNRSFVQLNYNHPVEAQVPYYVFTGAKTIAGSYTMYSIQLAIGYVFDDAQINTSGREIANRAIVDLKNGYLVVQLPANDSVARIFINSFKDNYSFSKVAFISEKDWELFKNTDFTNPAPNLSSLPSGFEALFGNKFLTIIPNYSVSKNRKQLHAFFIRDAYVNDIDSPFPYKYNLPVNSEIALVTLVRNINVELTRYYESNIIAK